MIKGLPFILIIVGILGFFIDIPTDELLDASLNAESARDNMIVNVATIFNLPWWGNVISIAVGILWIWLRSSPKEEQ